MNSDAEAVRLSRGGRTGHEIGTAGHRVVLPYDLECDYYVPATAFRPRRLGKMGLWMVRTNSIGGYTLPRLPFGEHRAVHDTSHKTLCEKMNEVMGGDWSMKSDSGNIFRHKVTTATIRDLNIATMACTHLYVQRRDIEYATLALPNTGQSVFRVDGKVLVEQAGLSAVFVSGRKRRIESFDNWSGTKSPLQISVLQHVAASMLADEILDPIRFFDVDNDRQLPLNIGDFSIDALLPDGFKAIDRCEHADHRILEFLGFNDQIYRLIVLLMNPKAFVAGHPGRTPKDEQKKIDIACDYILANLDKTVTLTRQRA